MQLSTKKILLSSALCLMLSACGGESQTAAPAAPADTKPTAAASSVPATENKNLVDDYVSPLPANAPVINVATTSKTLPFSFSATNGGVVGMDTDVIRKIGEAEGFKVQFHKRNWQTLFTDVDEGTYDLAISGISYSDDRAAKYALSDSYATNASVMMFKDEALVSKLKTLGDTAGLRVGTLDGSKHATQIKEAGVAKEILPYKTTFLLFGGLMKNEVDVILQDRLLLQQYVKNNPNEKLHIVAYEADNLPEAQLVMVMKKGNTELQARVNKGLATIKQNGELDKIRDKWLGTNSK
ncbi:substrate-binding periplasmic protein [Kingella kingae]|uniref:substrate-binding periplasmic protein n=1 Tax=Kingella kingae TaxID=504 RepID=UPI00254D51AF|nr:transporter substrate-binding domain-containing protein [Kingella kingae]MDK4533751.1 transporter substrate-binding domain-containing protein [Kingella kingae]